MLLRSGSRLTSTFFIGLVFITTAILFIIFSSQAPPSGNVEVIAADPAGIRVIFDEMGSALFDIFLLLVIVLLSKQQSEEEKKRTWLQRLIQRANSNDTAKKVSTLKTV